MSCRAEEELRHVASPQDGIKYHLLLFIAQAPLGRPRVEHWFGTTPSWVSQEDVPLMKISPRLNYE